MLLNRRKFSLLLGTAMAVPAMAIAKTDVAPATHLTDMAGRSVILAKEVKRIVLLDARDILTIALLHPAPSELVAGWADTARLDSEVLRKTYEQRQDGTVIEVVGGSSPDTISHEKIIALQPDLVVATAYSDPDLGTGELAQRLSRANIPIVFSNVSSNTITHTDTGSNPFDETATLMRMWGKILGSSSQAEEFITFVDKHRRIITSRLGNVAPTKTYLEIQSTYEDCCWAAGQQIWGNLLEQAGGRNLSAIKAPWYAHISTEQLMIEAPDVYIATGGAYAADMRPAVGPGLDPVSARAGLKRLTERTGFEILPAVQNDRVHCIWTGLLTIAPLQILFLEVAAKWLHPEIFVDLDPGNTLEEINHRFLGKRLAPPCWISLKDDPKR